MRESVAGNIPCSPTGPAARFRLYEQAASLVPLGAFTCDLATDRLSWTSELFDIFGLPDDSPERGRVVQMYSEESRALLERKRARAIATRSGFSLDAHFARPDGTDRWIRITAAVSGRNGRAETLYGMKQDITADHARWEALRAQAECDPLTGIANRARFQRFLDADPTDADESSSADIGALVLFDLDGFKQINDDWGHAAGDACLAAFGQRLRQAFPQARLIARIGGDEFALLLPPVASHREAEKAVSIQVGRLLRPVLWTGRLLPLRASVGLACASRAIHLDPAELFLAADRDLYERKRDRAAGVRIRPEF